MATYVAIILTVDAFIHGAQMLLSLDRADAGYICGSLARVASTVVGAVFAGILAWA